MRKLGRINQWWDKEDFYLSKNDSYSASTRPLVRPWQQKIKPGDFFLRVVKIGSKLSTTYGEVIEPPFRQDSIPITREMELFRFAKTYSQARPQGEKDRVFIGTIITLISAEAFEYVRSIGWPCLICEEEKFPHKKL